MGPMLGLLGPPLLVRRDRVAPLRLRPKAIALIAYLALTDREVPRHEVARLLFPEAEGPLAALRWHLAHVRSMGPALLARGLRATRSAVTLHVPTDVTRFSAGADLVMRRPGTPDAARILALYRGDLVSGLSVSTTAEFDNWLYVAQESLRRRFRQATVAFARWTLASRRAHEAVAPLARLVTVDPYYEEGHILLIEAYEALGEAGHAAGAYDRYQRIVRRELAAEPRPVVASRFETAVATRPTLPREDLVPLREVTLHVVDWAGAEPTILALHGSAGMAHTFGALAERLTPVHRFVGVDLRGHGFSDKPPSGYDLERHVADIAELIEALHLRRPVLLGHSAGGAIATFVAARTDVAGLILLEGMIGDRAFSENAAAQAAPLAGSLGQPVAGFDTYLATWRARWGPLTDEAERLAERWARFALAPLPDGRYRERAIRAAVEAEWASIIAADGLGALARVTCPILIVQALKPWIGGRPYFTPRIVEAQRRAAPAADLFVARDADHATMIRDPDRELIAAITRFTDACARGSSRRRPRAG
ncbi:MAG TPA: alpha/beta fold hydrolase [Methylomirabilota bacterium]|nr:alpha/beta fold hydrolase [Methylomirabilota bacterium]